MKKKETMLVEKILLKSCFGSNLQLAKQYGCAEVTIGFPRNRRKKEIVDFLAYNARTNIFRCYEIKVSKADLKSDEAKSWYGNYNYLVVSDSLYEEIKDFSPYLPQGVGLMVCFLDFMDWKIVIPPSRVKITDEMAELLKDSLIRSMFYKMSYMEEQ